MIGENIVKIVWNVTKSSQL